MCPNTKGVRFSYINAVAKTLEEIDEDIVKGLENLGLDPTNPSIIIHTLVKDGADGMGEVSVHKEKADKSLPDKALRFSFCILKCSVMHNGEEVTIFEEPKPNSVQSNRPIVECIGDENDASTVNVCIGPVERERLVMKDKVMRVHITENIKRAHSLTFSNSMIDEKWDRSHGGLAGAGSRFLCTLCDAVRDESLQKADSYCITRTLSNITETAAILRTNPNKLSDAALSQQAHGVKCDCESLLTTEPWEWGIDATHADINMGNFFKTLIYYIREVAQVTSWGKTADVKDLIDIAETRLDEHMMCEVGLSPSLMMPGNYARDMFKHVDKMVEVVDNPAWRSALIDVLGQFCKLRRV
ncbi:LOW QUALITY PROTEIN: V(D)J recombination-activating protein 1-like [Branchiostoma floridae x Branchiostoma japonicum]